jgi:hypothetical protein
LNLQEHFSEWFLRNELKGPILKYSDGGMFLVQARSESMTDGTVESCAPVAVGQAIAWAILTKFVMCLSFCELWLLKVFQTKESAFLYLKWADLGILHPDIGR